MSVVIVFAFDPVPELDDGIGVLSCDEFVAARLVAAHRLERMEPHLITAPLRYVPGSRAYAAAREALRRAAATHPGEPGPKRARRTDAKEE